MRLLGLPDHLRLGRLDLEGLSVLPLHGLVAIALAASAHKGEAAHLGLLPPGRVLEGLHLVAARALWLDDGVLRDAGVWDSGESHGLGEVLLVLQTVGAAIPLAVAGLAVDEHDLALGSAGLESVLSPLDHLLFLEILVHVVLSYCN